MRRRRACFPMSTSSAAREIAPCSHGRVFLRVDGHRPFRLANGREVFTASFAGEESDFVRFNKSVVRQATSVVQRTVTIDLIEGDRHAVGEVSLSGDAAQDRDRLTRLIGQLRDVRTQLPADPHLIYSTEVQSTARRNRHELPDSRHVADQVEKAGTGSRPGRGLRRRGGL